MAQLGNNGLDNVVFGPKTGHCLGKSTERALQLLYVVAEVLASTMAISVFGNREKQLHDCGSKNAVLTRCFVAAVLLLVVVFSTGCNRKQKQTLGPPLVIFIVDRTSSTTEFQGALLKYSAEALYEYSKEGPMHFVLVNLDEKPSMDIEKSGDLTSDQVDEILTHVKKIDYNGKGTDIVGAFDKAYEYYTYEKKKPRAFRLLCFTDGLVQAPRGQKFRQWSELDANKFKKSGASVGVYFIDPSVRQQVESALSGTGALIKERNQAKSEVKEETYDLPGIAQ